MSKCTGRRQAGTGGRSTAVESMAEECAMALRLAIGREPESARAYDKYQSLALAVRSRLLHDWLATEGLCRADGTKRVNYLSLEFLQGRTLQNAVLNLGIEDEARGGIRALGMALEDVYEQEHDAGLGNGGLGRLAACFLDSLATQRYPACGYGIRYEYGMFRQELRDGHQVERPDNWLARGNPWETARPDERVPVRFGGRTEYRHDGGALRVEWIPDQVVWAIPYETLVPGFRNGVVNPLVLWSASSSDSFNLSYFNHGDYLRAVEDLVAGENISKVLYPGDNTWAGRELRLRQQYFFVAASLHRILSQFREQSVDWDLLPRKTAIHLNDTHPVIAIPELMRLLVDEHGLPWERAWDLSTQVFAYTNHTLMPEALERWDAGLFRALLPRHEEIICEINARFLSEVAARWPGDNARLRRMSVFEEEGGRKIRMAHLAIVGSHAVNGVARLHTDLLKQRVFRDFCEFWPAKFHNITNGITQRRWLHQANPSLSRLICETIGSGWMTDLTQLARLEASANDSGFRAAWASLKRLNAGILCAYARELTGVSLDPHSMFDVQVKRMHEYKRQLLNVLRVVAHYLRIKDSPGAGWVPRTVIIAGKAAPGYLTAKLVIKLASDVAAVVNADAQSNRFLKLLFLPNYGVSLAERVFPASDLSEQISTAGTEASGTGNMKFALNGALTIGTMDGATIEICDAVGRENMFVFGLSEPEVAALWASGYRPRDIYESNPLLRRAIGEILNGRFSPGEPARFAPLLHRLLDADPFLVLADFASYLQAQDAVDEVYRDQDLWVRKAVLNVSRIGRFSSDRSIAEYASKVWGLVPLRTGRSAAKRRPGRG